MAMRRRTELVGLMLAMTVLFVAGEARGQFWNPTRPERNVNRNAYQRPTVSPYLQLLNNNFIDVPNYQTLVRPQIEQQQINRQQQAELQNVQRQVSQNAAQAAGAVSQPAGPSRIRGTGHQTQYLQLLHESRDPTSPSRARRPIFLDYSRFYTRLSNSRFSGN